MSEADSITVIYGDAASVSAVSAPNTMSDERKEDWRSATGAGRLELNSSVQIAEEIEDYCSVGL